MAYVVAEPCVDCRYTDCVVVCPCECFYGDERQLYINPMDCIDCGSCQPECPVDAIFPEEDLPERWRAFTQINAERVKVLIPLGRNITEKQPRPS